MEKGQLFGAKYSTDNQFKEIRPGWTIRVHQKIKEGEKTRTQAFEGIVIARKHGNEAGGTITVRKIYGETGVEKIFPVFLPTITKVEVLKKSKVRRAKLYYLQKKSAREIRRKTKELSQVSTEKVAPKTE